MMDWLAKMLDLPAHFLFSSNGKGGGVIHGTASEATLVALLGARSRTLHRLGRRPSDVTPISSDEHPDFSHLSRMVAYGSEQAHSSVERAALLGAVNFRSLPTDSNLSLRGDTVAQAIEEDRKRGMIPFYVVATLGTTNSCAFDNLLEIGQVCE